MDYMQLIEGYAKNGGSVEKMWESVAVTEEAMAYIKETNPEKYECLLRKLSGALYGKHYTDELAHHDVEKLAYTDGTGVKRKGAHWSADEVETATATKTFPKGTNKWDKYVAYNVTYALLSQKFDDAQILDAAYLWWFADENWHDDGKIWSYLAEK